MSVSAPEFIESPFFEVTETGWRLKDGAPDKVVEEFEKYMKEYEESLEKGVIL